MAENPIAIQETSRALLESGRVPLIFNVERYDSTEGKEIPFVTALFANLSGDNKSNLPLADRKFEFVDSDSLKNLPKKVKPRLHLETKSGEYDVVIEDLDDLRPDRLLLRALQDSG